MGHSWRYHAFAPIRLADDQRNGDLSVCWCLKSNDNQDQGFFAHTPPTYEWFILTQRLVV